MAKQNTPQDPRVAAIVERLEKDFYQLQSAENLQDVVKHINKDWEDLKKLFGNYIWILKP